MENAFRHFHYVLGRSAAPPGRAARKEISEYASVHCALLEQYMRSGDVVGLITVTTRRHVGGILGANKELVKLRKCGNS